MASCWLSIRKFPYFCEKVLMQARQRVFSSCWDILFLDRLAVLANDQFCNSLFFVWIIRHTGQGGLTFRGGRRAFRSDTIEGNKNLGTRNESLLFCFVQPFSIVYVTPSILKESIEQTSRIMRLSCAPYPKHPNSPIATEMRTPLFCFFSRASFQTP